MKIQREELPLPHLPFSTKGLVSICRVSYIISSPRFPVDRDLHVFPAHRASIRDKIIFHQAHFLQFTCPIVATSLSPGDA